MGEYRNFAIFRVLKSYCSVTKFLEVPSDIQDELLLEYSWGRGEVLPIPGMLWVCHLRGFCLTVLALTWLNFKLKKKSSFMAGSKPAYSATLGKLACDGTGYGHMVLACS